MNHSHQPINQIALDTLKAATNVVFVYAKSARPTLIKLGAAVAVAVSFWVLGLGLLTCAIHDKVVLGDAAVRTGSLIGFAVLAFVLSAFTAWLGILAVSKKETKPDSNVAYQPAF